MGMLAVGSAARRIRRSCRQRALRLFGIFHGVTDESADRPAAIVPFGGAPVLYPLALRGRRAALRRGRRRTGTRGGRLPKKGLLTERGFDV